jgi:hypothetical protein
VIDDGTVTGLVHVISTDKILTALFLSGAIIYIPPLSQGCKQLNLGNECNDTQDSIVIIADDYGFLGIL